MSQLGRLSRVLSTAALLLAVGVPTLPAPFADAVGVRFEAVAQELYYPDPWPEWEHRRPEEVGMDAGQLQAAIEFAKEQETDAPRDLETAHYLSFGREPFGEGIGPFKERGDPAGIIVRNGYIVAEWGDPNRVDMTFSVTKSFLSTTVALAFDRGLIRSVEDTVSHYMAPVVVLGYDLAGGRGFGESVGESHPLDLFATPHNRGITWNDLLRQTSDWEGELWGKPDWADRPSGEPSEWMTRARVAPGTTYEYNDVRVNVLALAAMNVWRRPLPEVLQEYVMEPIGASPTWRWYGYDNSWVLLDGRAMQAVSGGGHWGGGMFISAHDQARFGLLTLRRGQWKDQQILSEEWVRMALTPTPAQPTYGFMNWFLNTGREMLPSAPESAFMHLGSGTNMVYVDPENDLVVVARWIQRDALDGLVERVLAAVEGGGR